MTHEEAEADLMDSKGSALLLAFGVLIVMSVITVVYCFLIFSETRNISESSHAEIMITVERTSETEGVISIERLK